MAVVFVGVFSLSTLAIMSNIANAQNNSNWIGSYQLGTIISKLIRSHTQITLEDAIKTALNVVGPNSTANSAVLSVQRGYLVYSVSVLDANNNSHILLIDAGNGKVLSNQEVSKFSSQMTNQDVQHYTNNTLVSK